jgi:hypothetical protein
METTYFFVEVEKGLDWNNGYLDYDNKVVENIKYAHHFESEEEAQNAASAFNVEFGCGGRIYARVR